MKSNSYCCKACLYQNTLFIPAKSSYSFSFARAFWVHFLIDYSYSSNIIIVIYVFTCKIEGWPFVI